MAGRAAGERRRWHVARRAAVVTPVLLIAVLLVEAVLAVTRTYLPDPEEPVEATVGEGRPGEPLRLVMLGDSTVRGVGASGSGGTLPVQVGERVAALLDHPVEVLGLGVSGATTRTVAEEQAPLLAAARPDVVVIVVGANDVTHLNAWWTMRERTSAMLEAVRAEVGPEVAVVLGGVPLFRTASAAPQPLRFVLDVLGARQRPGQRAGAADAGVPYVDIATLASPRFVGVPESMSSDGFHPADVGYGFWADALAPAVAEAVRGADRR